MRDKQAGRRNELTNDRLTPTPDSFVGIIAAMRQELTYVHRGFQAKERRKADTQLVWVGTCRGRRVVLVQGGMGKTRAEKAARFLLERYPLSALLCIGFGGGVKEGMRTGDIVLCPLVYSTDGKSAHSGPMHSDAQLLTQAAQALAAESIPFHLGNGLTVDRVLADPARKEQVGQEWPVQVVDMESFWISRLASRRRVPVLVARAITDTVDQPLPNVAAAAPEGVGRAALHLLQHPTQIPALFRLARNARLAARNLGILVVSLADEMERSGA